MMKAKELEKVFNKVRTLLEEAHNKIVEAQDELSGYQLEDEYMNLDDTEETLLNCLVNSVDNLEADASNLDCETTEQLIFKVCDDNEEIDF